MQRAADLTGMKSVSSLLSVAKKARILTKVTGMPKYAGLVFSGFGGDFTN